MSEQHPILFSTSMVEAIRAGMKTVTRRVMVPQPEIYNGRGFTENGYDGSEWSWKDREWDDALCTGPFGVPGDILWVRETFAPTGFLYPAFTYKAGYEGTVPKWKPSLFMPRSATRIFLRVEAIDIQRLQDISREDAVAEGTRFIAPSSDDGRPPADYDVALFAQLWNSLNSKRGYSWEVNPWVWVIRFKRSVS